MRLFHWNDLETCRNYGPGNAIVMAPDLETARVELRRSLEAWAAENREWEWSYADEEDRAALVDKIERDVAAGPAMVSEAPCGVVIRGSE